MEHYNYVHTEDIQNRKKKHLSGQAYQIIADFVKILR